MFRRCTYSSPFMKKKMIAAAASGRNVISERMGKGLACIVLSSYPVNIIQVTSAATPISIAKA